MYLANDVCASFFRAPHRPGDGLRKKNTVIPLNVHVGFIMIMEYIFRNFLEIVSPYRFRWAQVSTVNYLGLLISKHLWITKWEANIIAK
jgi:hypothetical protein